MLEPRPRMTSARPLEMALRVEYRWNTRTGSSELNTITAEPRWMRVVRAAMAARATSPAGIGKSPVWCSPMPKKSTPTWSASTPCSTTLLIVSAWASGRPFLSWIRSPNVSRPKVSGNIVSPCFRFEERLLSAQTTQSRGTFLAGSRIRRRCEQLPEHESGDEGDRDCADRGVQRRRLRDRCDPAGARDRHSPGERESGARARRRLAVVPRLRYELPDDRDHLDQPPSQHARDRQLRPHVHVREPPAASRR